MPAKRKTGGGKYAGISDPVYFFAANPSLLGAIEKVKVPFDKYILIAVNEIKGNDLRWRVLLGDKYKLLLDSGVFNLAMSHARKNDLGLAESISLPPCQVEGFDELFEKYVSIVSENEERLWGYVELDQGSREDKIATRSKLENEFGLNPIPVFHPLSDGWDYFDYLLESYDRICIGNLVSSSPSLRIKLLREIYRRWESHQDVWIHALGLSPHSIANTYRASSCDSSSWIGAQRWGRFPSLNYERSDNALIQNLSPPIGLDSEAYYEMTAALLTNYLLYDKARTAQLNDVKSLLSPN